MPEQSSADAAIRAAQELIHALKHPEPATPFQRLSNEHLQALQDLADIFASAAPRVEAGNPNNPYSNKQDLKTTTPSHTTTGTSYPLVQSHAPKLDKLPMLSTPSRVHPYLIHNFLPNSKKSKRNNPTNIQLSLPEAQHITKPNTKTLHYKTFSSNLPLTPLGTNLLSLSPIQKPGEALEYKELLTHSNDPSFANNGKNLQQTNLVASHKESKDVSNTPMHH
jgi:hypothetical protein